jgi:hypothetical protein
LDLAELAARNIRELESLGRLVDALRDQRRTVLEAIIAIGKSSRAETVILGALNVKPKTLWELCVLGSSACGLVWS